MKGISQFIVYTLTILFGFVTVTIFSLLIYGYYDQVLKTNIEVGLREVSLHTWSGISKLYELGDKSAVTPTNSTAVIIANISLNYPQNVVGSKYEVELISATGIWNQIINITIDGVNASIKDEETSGPKIVAKTTQTPFISYKHAIPNLPFEIQGKYRPGEEQMLRYVRYNYNGTEKNVVILGEYKVIVDLVNITN